MSLFPKPFQIEHTPKTLNAHGVWELGTPTVQTYKGSVQPLTGYELSILDTGSQGMGKVWIRTKTALHSRKPGSDEAGDVLLWNNDRWELIDDKPYLSGVISHHTYLAEWRPTP